MAGMGRKLPQTDNLLTAKAAPSSANSPRADAYPRPRSPRGGRAPAENPGDDYYENACNETERNIFEHGTDPTKLVRWPSIFWSLKAKPTDECQILAR